MHLTLKKEATKPPAKNFLQQQVKFDRFIECYNCERPHQALNMKYPAESIAPRRDRTKGYRNLVIPSTIVPSR
jgi:transposase InsO family protein